MLAFQMSYRHTITACITNNAFNSARSNLDTIRSITLFIIIDREIIVFQNYIYLSDIFERHIIK